MQVHSSQCDMVPLEVDEYLSSKHSLEFYGIEYIPRNFLHINNEGS